MKAQTTAERRVADALRDIEAIEGVDVSQNTRKHAESNLRVALLTLDAERAGITVPDTYTPTSRYSWIGDLCNRGRDPGATKRLEEWQSRTVTSAASSGGSFDGPDFLAQEWVDAIRASSPITAVLGNAGISDVGEAIQIPKVHASSGLVQNIGVAEGGALTETDPVMASTDVVSEGSWTTGGTQTVGLVSIITSFPAARQWFERGFVGMDLALADAAASATAEQLELEIINGPASTARRHTGFLNAASATVTASGSTQLTFLSDVCKIVQNASVSRKRNIPYVAIHPRRLAWLLGGSSTSKSLADLELAERPNQRGVFDTGLGFAFVSSAGIPTSLGSGTNEDACFTFRPQDVYLGFDAAPRTFLFKDISNSAQAVVRIQSLHYSYFAVKSPESVIKLTGYSAVL